MKPNPNPNPGCSRPQTPRESSFQLFPNSNPNFISKYVSYLEIFGKYVLNEEPITQNVQKHVIKNRPAKNTSRTYP